LFEIVKLLGDLDQFLPGGDQVGLAGLDAQVVRRVEHRQNRHRRDEQEDRPGMLDLEGHQFAQRRFMNINRLR